MIIIMKMIKNLKNLLEMMSRLIYYNLIGKILISLKKSKYKQKFNKRKKQFELSIHL